MARSHKMQDLAFFYQILMDFSLLQDSSWRPRLLISSRRARFLMGLTIKLVAFPRKNASCTSWLSSRPDIMIIFVPCSGVIPCSFSISRISRKASCPSMFGIIISSVTTSYGSPACKACRNASTLFAIGCKIGIPVWMKDFLYKSAAVEIVINNQKLHLGNLHIGLSLYHYTAILQRG